MNNPPEPTNIFQGGDDAVVDVAVIVGLGDGDDVSVIGEVVVAVVQSSAWIWVKQMLHTK